jgi:hypothetical protein
MGTGVGRLAVGKFAVLEQLAPLVLIEKTGNLRIRGCDRAHDGSLLPSRAQAPAFLPRGEQRGERGQP